MGSRDLINSLKPYSRFYAKDTEKELLYHDDISKTYFVFGVTMNFIKEKNMYEVFLFLQEDKKVLGGLLAKSCRNRLYAFLYYKYLQHIIKKDEYYIINYILNKTVYSTKIIQK